MGREAGTRPRVVIVLAELGDGGTERVSLNLAVGLSARGYEVEILALSRAPLGHTPPPGIRTRLAGIPRDAPRGVWLVRAFVALYRTLRDLPEGAIVLTAMLRTNWLVSLANIGARRRVLAVAVEHTLYGQVARDTSAARAAMNLWLRRTSFRWLDAVVVPSHAGAAALARELHAEATAVTAIPNPVVSPPAPRRVRQTNPVPIVLAVGRLHPQKDYGTLIAAFARLSSRRTARLRILGNGVQRAHVEALIAEYGLTASVEVAGFVADPAAAYQEADLLVLASRWEVLPTTLIEAMHHGCPVVATDCDHGPREILDDGRLGTLVPVGDVAALAAAMEVALDAPVDRDALRARAADYAIGPASAAYDAFLANLVTARRVHDAQRAGRRRCGWTRRACPRSSRHGTSRFVR